VLWHGLAGWPDDFLIAQNEAQSIFDPN
jgi:hypothetical protein